METESPAENAGSGTGSPIRNSGSAARTAAATKRGTVLRWLLRWEIADIHVLGDLLKLQRSGTYATLQKMVSAGYIGRAAVNGCPTPVYHLRQSGLAAAQELTLLDGYMDDATLSAAVYPSRLNLAHVQHDLLVQRYLLAWLQKQRGRSIGYLSARQLDHRKFVLGADASTRAGGKIPDALIVWQDTTGKQHRAAVELQQTAEHPAIVERKLAQYIRAIQHGEVQTVVYASTRRTVLQNMQRIATQGVRRWWYNDTQRQWYPDVDSAAPRPLDQQVPRDAFRWRALESGLDHVYYQFAIF